MTTVCQRGRLIIISGPSGAGKSTVVRRLIAQCPLPLQLSISATTRPPRPGEVHGRDYYFVSPEEFERLRDAGAFLEYKQVYGKYWYGTLRQQVDEALELGKWVILEIDVQGALTVMEQQPDVLSFFVHPGSREELERRLRNRGTDDEQSIQRRLQVADEELAYRDRYKFEIINRDVDAAVEEICRTLQQYAIGVEHAG
ncbi:MAG: guanylate kinase [Planctomycetota bacterium]|nr:MAG: guanylate kinase [Planctomycetota bacterium]